MTLKKNGLNDSDKIVVTMALWITAVTLFITALTLPMLPGEVMTFYRGVGEAMSPDKYSKYNNLFLVLITLIPMVIIVIAAVLKKHNRLQNNFMSVMLFSVMLSLSISSLIIYGISKQFGASGSTKGANIHGIVVLIASFVLSVSAAVFPAIYRRPGAEYKPTRLKSVLDEHWAVGAFGYLAAAMAASFIPGFYAYIPFAAGSIAYVIFVAVYKRGAAPVRTEKSEKNI